MSTQINYKDLLIKYINHVADNEGVTFIKDTWKSDDFNESEWAELVKLDKETWKLINSNVD
jgi:hypothetical protein